MKINNNFILLFKCSPVCQKIVSIQASTPRRRVIREHFCPARRDTWKACGRGLRSWALPSSSTKQKYRFLHSGLQLLGNWHFLSVWLQCNILAYDSAILPTGSSKWEARTVSQPSIKLKHVKTLALLHTVLMGKDVSSYTTMRQKNLQKSSNYFGNGSEMTSISLFF